MRDVVPQPILFTDVDGVLNAWEAFDWSAGPRALIYPECAKWFNLIIEQACPNIVVSSSWRYMVHGGSMTVGGFGHMLRTHGLRGEFIDVTPSEEDVDAERHRQITVWLGRNPSDVTRRYCVLDDEASAGNGHPFVQTNGKVGLTERDAERVVELLLNVERL